MQILLISLLVLLVFVAITLGEAWFVKTKLNVDIVADIKATFDRGDTGKAVFKASGIIAFIIAQPFFLTLLLGRISQTVTAILLPTLLRTAQMIGGQHVADAVKYTLGS